MQTIVKRNSGSISRPFGGGLGWGLLITFVTSLLVTSCARMGNPDGGWFDELPPRVVMAEPNDRGVNVTSGKINIYFNEFIKVENAMEKIVISPPQMESPQVKVHGKRIMVNLKDSLLPNTTYTVDFSDAISDNNESNPMGNYTYTFSTGEHIDTLEVSGYVLDASNLEPIKGIVVGLWRPTPALPEREGEMSDTMQSKDLGDTISLPSEALREGRGGSPIRVSRTDSRGHFIIRGVAPGQYVAGAVMDMDGNYTYSQKSETMAFSKQVIEPSSFVDTRQDTIWQDALHIKDILLSKYVHFTPDNIVLRAFTHTNTERHYIKAERKEPDHFTLFFTAPAVDTVEAEGTTMMHLPELTLMAGEDSDVPLMSAEEFKKVLYIDPSLRGDTVTYWLRDTAMVNTDTLNIVMKTLQTDTAGVMMMQSDTLQILSKVPYAKRMKEKQKELEEWQKKVERKRKRLAEGEFLTAADTIMPPEILKPKYMLDSNMSPDGVVKINFPTPMQRVDTAAIHLYVEQDSLWYRAPMEIVTERVGQEVRSVTVFSDWLPGAKYSFEVDTLAFEDIYGKTSVPYKAGISVKSMDEFASLFVNVTLPQTVLEDSCSNGMVIVELLDTGDKPVRRASVAMSEEKGGIVTAEFYYLNGGNYYMRAIMDRNGNGIWDPGDYALEQQPEEVYYYPDIVEVKAKWDITKSWNPMMRPLFMQKPGAITKQKADQQKQIQQRNAQRAMQKGIEIPLKYRQY